MVPRQLVSTSHWPTSAGLLTALALGGCCVFSPSQSRPQACTLIGCVDSLVIDLSGSVPEEFTVDVTAADGTTMQVHCPGGEAQGSQSGDMSPGAMCLGDSVVFSAFTPEEASIRITGQGGEITQTARPTYEPVRPNGPDCPPECRQGHVQIEIP